MAKDIYQAFCEFVKMQKLIDEGDRVIMGVSGGADSITLLVLMCRLAKDIQLELTAVHVNHMLRGDEADSDEAFVKEFCRQIGVRCVSVKADVRGYAFNHSLSLEEAGRIARYQAFMKTAGKLYGPDADNGLKIAVAHHKDDNAETVILNMIRGTGLKGMQGMLPKTDQNGFTLIRPLLCFTREEIEQFLEDNRISYCIDSTNLKDEYARNKVRLNILPDMREINPQVASHINDASQIILQAQEYIEKEAEKASHIVVDSRPEGMYLDLERFKFLEPIIQSMVIHKVIGNVAGSLKDISRVHIVNVLSLMDKQTGRRVRLPYDVVAIRSYSNIIIRKITPDDLMNQDIAAQEKDSFRPEQDAEIETAAYEMSLDPEKITDDPLVFELWDGIEISFRKVEVNNMTKARLTTKNQYTKAFDYDKINGTLVLRKPEPGDEIRFFGGTKTVKKFFVDQKVPQDDRRRTLVLRDDSEVMWIIGYRLSETYKITDSTKTALLVKISGGYYE